MWSITITVDRGDLTLNHFHPREGYAKPCGIEMVYSLGFRFGCRCEGLKAYLQG